MRLAIAFLVVLVMAPAARADSNDRADAVIDALGVNKVTATKLHGVLDRYDLDLARLERRKIELRRRLVVARNENPKNVEAALDDVLANQRALAQNEEQLLTRVRQILPAKQTAQLLVLLAATEPTRPDMTPIIVRPADIDMEQPADTQAHHDPDELFPPGSDRRNDTRACDPFVTMHSCRQVCDPFSSMHGCR